MSFLSLQNIFPLKQISVSQSSMSVSSKSIAHFLNFVFAPENRKQESLTHLIHGMKEMVGRGDFKKYSKTCVRRPLSKIPQISFRDQLSFNAGQKYCRMLQGEHSAILLAFIKLPSVIKIFVLFIYFL